MNCPIITIDGPSASGKGTLAFCLAKVLRFHYLDSGALYRMLAYNAQINGVESNQVLNLQLLAKRLKISFSGEKQFLDGFDVTKEIREEKVGLFASLIARHPSIRHILLDLQRNYARFPGLVGEGRDMGTVVFPNALLKIFVVADVNVRAARRLKQLHSFGKNHSFEEILQDLRIRDERDKNRLIAPLKQPKDAKILDTSNMTSETAMKIILSWCENLPEVGYF